MGITLTNIRVRNFRSIEYIDLDLGQTNILIGQNNSGKSNLLKAVDIALGGHREVSESDIFLLAGERLSRDKTAIIDILLRPVKYKKHSLTFGRAFLLKRGLQLTKRMEILLESGL